MNSPLTGARATEAQWAAVGDHDEPFVAADDLAQAVGDAGTAVNRNNG